MLELSRYRRKVYRNWVNSVEARGLEARLSISEWWSLWEPYWADRMENPYSLALARIGDKGHYEVGNVFICTNSQNARDAAVNRALRAWPTS